jgi:methylated-DNA-protein-cysteine methyltransferase-like protein
MVTKQIGTTFSERVVKAALAIPKGRVTTYGRISRAAGGGGLGARSVTAILARAWEAGEKNIPFHRIVYSDGRIWINEEYRVKRLKLYKEEGIHLEDDRIKNFADVVYDY